jgi:hypothetical protein
MSVVVKTPNQIAPEHQARFEQLQREAAKVKPEPQIVFDGAVSRSISFQEGAFFSSVLALNVVDEVLKQADELSLSAEDIRATIMLALKSVAQNAEKMDLIASWSNNPDSFEESVATYCIQRRLVAIQESEAFASSISSD